MRALLRTLIGSGVAAGALAFGPPPASAKSCADALLADWKDGHIDRIYPIACYRAALASMPEDVRVYSSAEEDIQRALQGRLAAPKLRATPHTAVRATTAHRRRQNQRPTAATVAATADSSSSIPKPLLVIGLAALLLVAGSAVAAVARRLRR